LVKRGLRRISGSAKKKILRRRQQKLVPILGNSEGDEEQKSLGRGGVSISRGTDTSILNCGDRSTGKRAGSRKG